MDTDLLEAGRRALNPPGKFKNPRKDAEFHGMATNLYIIGKWNEERLVAHDREVLSEKYLASEKYQIEIANRRYARRIVTAELAEKRALAAEREAEEKIKLANEKRAQEKQTQEKQAEKERAAKDRKRA
jgi:hypothetical protein